MRFDRSFRDNQPKSDLLVRLLLGDQCGDLGFACGERIFLPNISRQLGEQSVGGAQRSGHVEPSELGCCLAGQVSCQPQIAW